MPTVIHSIDHSTEHLDEWQAQRYSGHKKEHSVSSRRCPRLCVMGRVEAGDTLTSKIPVQCVRLGTVVAVCPGSPGMAQDWQQRSVGTAPANTEPWAAVRGCYCCCSRYPAIRTIDLMLFLFHFPLFAHSQSLLNPTF